MTASSPAAPQVLARFIKYMALATVALAVFWLGYQYLNPPQPGDFYVRQGDIRLGDKDWQGALESFDAALEEEPNHRGALMGRAIVFLQQGRLNKAEAELSHLITFLRETLTGDDPTGRGVLAAAHANRGILHDRAGRYEKALADYVMSLRIDAEAVAGPGTIDKILYGTPNPATVRDRAVYLAKQLKLPEEERLLRVPELDRQQRMAKP